MNLNFKYNIIILLLSLLSKSHRINLLWLLVLIFIASICEVISIGILYPLIYIMINPENINLSPFMKSFMSLIKVNDSYSYLLPIVILFISTIIITGIIRISLVWFVNIFSSSIGTDISFRMYRNCLHQDYETHINCNSSEIITLITRNVDDLIYVIKSVLNLISSFVIILIVISVLILIEPFITCLTFLIFGLIYFLILKTLRSRQINLGKKVVFQYKKVTQLVQEGIGGIKEIILDKSQDYFVNIFNHYNKALRINQAKISFITLCPRHAVESIAMLVITVLVLVIVERYNGLLNALPALAVFAITTQRLLPLFQQIYASLTVINSGTAAIVSITKMLESTNINLQSQFKYNNSIFNDNISLSMVSFQFKNSNVNTLDNINLTIKKGARIGFVGVTGSGKSTLIDVIMGLLKPTSGSIYLDGLRINSLSISSWQSQIAHVPQNLFLLDSTIAENIAFGINKDNIDYKKLNYSASKAQILSYILDLPKGFDTIVGERGIKLSGGQRQRIGIARSLYKEATIIIFDEATSALDTETELEIIDSISSINKDITILMVAHRINTLKECDTIVVMEGGGIKRICTYDDLL